MYLHFIIREKEGDCARSFSKMWAVGKGKLLCIISHRRTVTKEQVQGKVKQHFLYNVPLGNSLSLNLRTANTEMALDKFGEQDITHSSPGAA